MRGEIELLRAAVAALRATRRAQVGASTTKRSDPRAVLAASVASFAAGVGVTAAVAAFAIYVLGLCR
jgi:hypothetical protein